MYFLYYSVVEQGIFTGTVVCGFYKGGSVCIGVTNGDNFIAHLWVKV